MRKMRKKFHHFFFLVHVKTSRIQRMKVNKKKEVSRSYEIEKRLNIEKFSCMPTLFPLFSIIQNNSIFSMNPYFPFTLTWEISRADVMDNLAFNTRNTIDNQFKLSYRSQMRPKCCFSPESRWWWCLRRLIRWCGVPNFVTLDNFRQCLNLNLIRDFHLLLGSGNRQSFSAFCGLLLNSVNYF